MQELLCWQKDQKKLHKKYAYKILLGVLDYFKAAPTLVDVPIPEVSVLVCQLIS
eukprot:m.22003 g.22003  ORF g.22003 m.22003 type:complete len:54 (+) comp28263_c0_seq5:973-1134(+)